MADAIELHQRKRASRARRSFAAVVGLWLVLAGALGTRHEAQVAHVVDPHTGELRHASALVHAHTGTDSDYHQVGGDSDNDTCAIATAIHQSVHVTAAPSIVIAPLALPGPAVASTIVAARSARVYRLAPKTSPPTRV
jgi:hypothetical protein